MSYQDMFERPSRLQTQTHHVEKTSKTSTDQYNWHPGPLRNAHSFLNEIHERLRVRLAIPGLLRSNQPSHQSPDHPEMANQPDLRLWQFDR